MQLTVAHTDVEPIVQPCPVYDLSGRAEVVRVNGVILDSLEDADLERGIMAVIQWDGCSWWSLPVGADAECGINLRTFLHEGVVLLF